jgi:F-type H+-transporting ATPase subunit gamma
VVLAEAEAYLNEKRAQGVDIDIAALGNRAIRILRRRGYELTWSGRLSLTALPDYDLARELSLRWLRRHETGEIDGVDVIYNTYAEIGRYEPIVETLVPPRLPPVTRADRWPPVVIDTDPRRLVARVLEQWAVVDLHARLLDAAASEHSARYQLMEGAVKNAERLIDELTQQVNIARQQEITTEMQELAVGAGLLDTKRDG